MTDFEAQEILRYHERTKHHEERYARSPGYMDWANQPDPFRTYEGAPALPLPLLKNDPQAGHLGLYETGAQPAPFTLEPIAGFLELSMGLSAWKAAAGARWPLRMNPSSGNLHPTEAHLILPPTGEAAAGVFHYQPLAHALERRATVPAELWGPIRAHFGGDGFLIGLTSIFWRESWKYGERALRYCNHDVGHALAALRLAANLFGWRLEPLAALSDRAVQAVLGLDRTAYPENEEEHPDLLCWVHAGKAARDDPGLGEDLVDAFAGIEFQGRPNALSPGHVTWEVIERAAENSRKPATAARRAAHGRRPWAEAGESALSAAAIIRRRRSATAFDRRTGIGRDGLIAMLDKTLARDDAAPFDAWPKPCALHLALFVHHVEGLAPGLYFLCRNAGDLTEIRRLTRPEFLWTEVAEGFPLYLLAPGNFRPTATRVSCHQDIAGEGAFSLGMLARFEDTVRPEPYRYRLLFWEAGMIGQVLYLEAEALGVRGTGIGCFFDDVMHAVLGLDSIRFQSLYHFTVGAPVEDPRMTTHPPYAHLKDR
jgi:SagB-type dehydrogenase family enzyme